MLRFEYRVIPSTDGEVGGDEIYLGTPTNDNGALLRPAPQGGNAIDVGAWCRAEETFTDRRGTTYGFVALNVTSEDPQLTYKIDDDLQVDFTAATTKDTTVTAWYVPRGGSGEPPPPPAVTCYGLDRAVNRFFRKSPIVAVSPNVGWPGGDSRTVATSDGGAAITAAAKMNGYVVDKTMVRIDYGANFDHWRTRGQPVKGPLGVAQGQSGIAIAFFEQEVRVRPINAIDHELFQVLHGKKLDLESLRRFIKTPVSDPPGGFARPMLALTLASLSREEVGVVRDRLRDLQDRTAAALDVTERVLRGQR